MTNYPSLERVINILSVAWFKYLTNAFPFILRVTIISFMVLILYNNIEDVFYDPKDL